MTSSYISTPDSQEVVNMRAPTIGQQSAEEGHSAPCRPELPHRWGLWPGIAISAALALVAMRMGTVDWLAAHGVSPLTAAIVLGILFGNTVYGRFAWTAGTGVNFSRQILLRAGVILYGFRLTLHDVGHVGFAGIVIDALVMCTTFILTVFLGVRVFGLDRKTAILIGAGSSICGAAAVMATEPVVRAKADQVTMAVSTVVVFGTAAIFLYPALYTLMRQGSSPIGAQEFGVYAGSTIHEVAQVFAAGRSVSEAVANTAVIAKMVRVMMLAPFLIVLSAWLSRGSSESQAHGKTRIRVPWFAVWFVAAVVFNSFGVLPMWLVRWVTSVDTFLLAMAMAALGMTTHLRAVRDAGPKPLLLGGVIFVWLIVGGAAINWSVLKLLELH
jgi:uncharacterized integral membrane protein (TIGR00698 family)